MFLSQSCKFNKKVAKITKFDIFYQDNTQKYTIGVLYVSCYYSKKKNFDILFIYYYIDIIQNQNFKTLH